MLLFFPGFFHVKNFGRFFRDFRYADMRREFFKAVCACCSGDGTDLEAFPSLTEQRVFAQNLDNDHSSDMPSEIGGIRRFGASKTWCLPGRAYV